MPIYDYHCDHCGHTFSAVQSYTDATLEVCPSCGKKPRKLMATPAIVFKGGGWYKTDSRVAPKDGGAEKPAAGGAEGAGDTKTDAGTKEPKPVPAGASDGAKANGTKGDAPSTGRSGTSDKPAAPAPKGEAASS